MKKQNSIYTLLIALLCFVSSCDYLGVSDQLAGGLQNTEQVFDNVSYTKRWYANVFAGIPDYSGINSVNVGAFKNPWTGMCDELVVGYGNSSKYNNSDRNAANMGFHRYGDCYKYIRQANIFLQKAHPIMTTGTQGDQLLEDELTQMKANVRFMRAFYHYLLFEQYGPIILVKDKIYNATEDQDVPRNTVDEVIEYIDSELTAVASELPQEPIFEDKDYRAWPTKGVALAVRAKLWLYAASPLLNGGYREALSVTNPDGTRLFPDYDAGKWEKALAACKDFIDYAEAGRYELYKEYKDDNGAVIDPDKSVYNLFQKYTHEIIWATANNDWGGMNGDAFDRRIAPRCEKNGLGSTGVTQELVDAFYMKDGFPVSATAYLPQSTLYQEEGYGTYKDQNDNFSKKYTNVIVSNRYLNREPRFYNTVFFNGRQWPVSCNQVLFYNGGNSGVQEGQATLTGYMLFKRFNRSVSLTNPGVASQFRPSIIFRLADFYLMYAEAANEVNPNDARVLKYLNLVRERAGLPDIETLNPAIRGNQELQRAAIQRERQIELATEGQRYFDVRRWMIADKNGEGRQNGYVHGMNVRGESNDKEDFNRIVEASQIVFNRKMYLYPMPDSEMRKTKNLVQNPGW
ncbi:starch-binding associating with outer membrane family protein [Bacteroides fragilis str. S38L5]|uniref:RagB/SusD family nutrient uptake outer membrane protein n=1 Tax=Bacteroides fragilis TaxID=817 RepID=UPI00044D10EF|nr:RagB/SusD family nutrient uptake outer membrane protein [Bacteroides fragilis]EYA94687.1 starch-binding associating with outer membrane family protein [Bacteroides fragilis str. S38L5]EYB13123.1 starch-binding associating with outer membrane family protein [Bacteroides fragilis str. S38L3]MCE9272138.1 RagB/SusD family nutrient uptake outer membrane protein [Bacteroides fragilis]MCE9295448.1 RagB/SusD family nutrient uptake outer membrane protein [Bacteroides fragilis]MCE9303488.1 RagB/SusD 